jgi:hypothetical protein
VTSEMLWSGGTEPGAERGTAAGGQYGHKRSAGAEDGRLWSAGVGRCVVPWCTVGAPTTDRLPSWPYLRGFLG